MTVVNPFDFFLEPGAESVPFAYDDLQRAELEPFLRVEPAGPRLAAWLASIPRAHPHTVGFLVESEPADAIRRPLPDPHGARRADERGHAREGQRLLPRLGLAAGGDAAAPGPRRALRVRLSDPARARSEAARWAGRPAAGLHRSPRVGRGLSAGRGLGGPRSHLGAPRRRGTHPAGRDAERGVGRAGLRPRRARAEVEFASRDVGDADPRGPARHQALHRRPVARRPGARRPRGRRACRRRRAADDGRRADVRVHRRHGRRGVEHRGGRPRRSGGSAAPCSAGCETASRREGCCISDRASGIRASRCRAGPSPVSGARTACRCGATRRSLAEDDRDYGHGTADARAFAEALAERLAVERRITCSPRSRIRCLRPQGAPAAGQRGPRGQQARRSRGARAAAPRLQPRPGHAHRLRPAAARACRERTARCGSRGCGCCARSTSSWCRAIRPSASGCRCTACRWARRSTSFRWIR